MSNLNGADPKETELETTGLETTESQRAELTRTAQDDEEPSTGPNLVLLYSLIGLALLAAIFIAGLIVLPFYRRR